jgi:protein-S-isoprenylcysteine O-methyltransferase Ste14
MKRNPPESCTNLSLNFLGVFSFFISIYVLRYSFPDLHIIGRTIISCIVLVLPIVAIEVLAIKVQNNPSAKLGASRSANNLRVGIKMLGLIGTFLVIAFMYWVIPEYHTNFFDNYFSVLTYAIPLLIALAWYYFLAVDMRMQEPEDGYWHMGCVILGKWNLVNKKILAEHYRAWLVKAFFFPLMLIFMSQNIEFLTNYNFDNINNSFISFYDFMYVFIFTIDVTFAAVGYAMTFRFLDSHIRSVEPTFVGWFVAILCYPPFWSAVFYGSYFAYNDGFYWGHMTENYPALQIAWGSIILISITIYSVATVCLGYRFSNLTYRGLVTNGPYRWTKHPAYVSKNLSWWLISVPIFANGDLDITIRQSLMLFGVNYIYYMRARTEENHLSNYPEYVEYAKWIEENGKLRWVGKLIPYLKYNEERAKSWNSLTWWRQMGKKEY